MRSLTVSSVMRFFRVIQEQAHCLSSHPLAALGVICKKFSQMQAAYLLVVGLQRLPRLPLRQRFKNLGVSLLV